MMIHIIVNLFQQMTQDRRCKIRPITIAYIMWFMFMMISDFDTDTDSQEMETRFKWAYVNTVIYHLNAGSSWWSILWGYCQQNPRWQYLVWHQLLRSNAGVDEDIGQHTVSWHWTWDEGGLSSMMVSSRPGRQTGTETWSSDASGDRSQGIWPGGRSPWCQARVWDTGSGARNTVRFPRQ